MQKKHAKRISNLERPNLKNPRRNWSFTGRQRECFYRNLRHMTFDTNFQLGKIWFMMVSRGGNFWDSPMEPDSHWIWSWVPLPEKIQ